MFRRWSRFEGRQIANQRANIERKSHRALFELISNVAHAPELCTTNADRSHQSQTSVQSSTNSPIPQFAFIVHSTEASVSQETRSRLRGNRRSCSTSPRRP